MNGIRQLLHPLAVRLGNMLARGTVFGSDDSSAMRTLQVGMLAGEPKDGIEHFEPYGYTSRPIPGAEHLAGFLDGDRSNGFVLMVADRRYRIVNLAEGEVAVHDDLGQKVHLTRTGIVIHTAQKCRIEAADIEFHGSKSYSWDVNGFGERWTWLSGTTWEHKTWQTGATINSVPSAIHPPEGP